MSVHSSDTIIALSTGASPAAIAVVRLSGSEAIAKTQLLWRGKPLGEQISHTLHLGWIYTLDNQVLDEVVIGIFKGPNSFTKEDVIEISCHGSPFIVQKIIREFLKIGVRYAEAGEFTKRAFLNGRFDLVQAEAVADVIAAETEAAHQAALYQMRGGFSETIKDLRQQLIHFASLIELELDFGEEDVEFANRQDLMDTVEHIQLVIKRLLESFTLGNVVKNGVPTVIAGKPNAGKSTLLNALLNEEKAIVSEIAGTTRDVIEDQISINGLIFRFIDTAGLRETQDVVEKIGVQRSYEKIKGASLMLYVLDLQQVQTVQAYERELLEAQSFNIPFLMVANKAEFCSNALRAILTQAEAHVLISAKAKQGIDTVKDLIINKVQNNQFKVNDPLLTNIRHHESLSQTLWALESVQRGLKSGLTGDFLAMDIRIALQALASITGEVSVEDLLANIFSRFCIGK
ncbi:MAG: tRNA uridine-5-carboxymethylaminomethyl(34) synthesis GTPase MnmE [Cytophagales bacterium]|nr:MAG: tRNA uridine-5-carboxymethylaminomethyl(34) synthesis GTPase MnmE [Cytophagales bacterium]TAF60268.1 MAG: tRNA uridine-5-carboxymethylaminomethyl(34) synthesis GTPase MnmE [Cytophagales bacterium]